MVETRPVIRRRLRARRRALSERERRRATRGLLRVAAASPAFRNRGRIAFYYPADGEADVLPLIERACIMGKHCYLPVIGRLDPRRLRFSPYRPGDPLVRNHFGIPEPAHAVRHQIGAAELDLVLLPLVAFDRHGNRLGMGAGFYDRTLAFLTRRRHWRRPVLWGVAHDFQRVDALAPRPWDVALDGCLTDARLYVFPSDPETSP